MAAIGTVLMVAVAGMTQAGFAGNLRYRRPARRARVRLSRCGMEHQLVHATNQRAGTVAAAALAVVIAAASAPFVIDDVRGSWTKSWWRIDQEAQLYGTVPEAISEAAGGREKLLACGTVYTGAFQTQAVAWYMHLHEMESEIFAFPPGTTIASNYSALSKDPLPDHRQDPQVGHRLFLRPLMARPPSTAARLPSRTARGR